MSSNQYNGHKNGKNHHGGKIVSEKMLYPKGKINLCYYGTQRNVSSKKESNQKTPIEMMAAYGNTAIINLIKWPPL